MDFFDRQDLARRRTGRLVVLFILAVILILAAVNAATYGLLRASETYGRVKREVPARFYTDRHRGEIVTARIPLHQRPETYVVVSLVTLGIIASGSLYKIAMLSSGGPAVAQMMGGRPIMSDPDHPEEAVLRNIVEEMSIASGVPVPQIYVMDDEEAINAFAAGFTQNDAVIGVTRGCLTRLTRDELQGVIAHEFSHILNGDMRLNLRLIGILHGILVMALLGYWILRVGGNSGSGRSSSSDKDSGIAAILLILAVGVGLLVIGYVGLLFGKLIQAAVSRQREFLADASAVQFTRNPSGLAGALKKIGQLSDGSRVQNASAIGAAHLFFSNISGSSLTNLLATHPPLEERIRAIDPTFDGRFEIGPGSTAVLEQNAPSQQGEVLAGMLGLAATGASRPRLPARDVTQTVGRPTPQTVRFASDLLASLPDELTRAVHDPFAARAVALAILVSDDPSARTRQLEIVRPQLDAATFTEMMRLLPAVAQLPDAAHLPLLDLTMAALRQMSGEQMRQFRAAARALIEADGRVSVFEYAMFRTVRNQLRPPGASRRPRAVQYAAINPLMPDIVTVLSALAYRTGADETFAADAFQRGVAELNHTGPIEPAEDRSLTALDAALNRLADSAPPIKRRVVQAAAQVVAADGVVECEEADLLRATCAALDVPLPPLISPTPEP